MILKHKEIKINYEIEGNGDVIVFLHGFLENLTMWNTIMPSFFKKYKCIAVDLLGHGETECLGYVHTMEDMAKVVKAVLDYNKIKKATLIGHSMGGYVTMAFLELFPEYVSSLILLNSTSYPDDDERKLNRSRAIDIVKKNPKAYTSMAIANLFAEENRKKFASEINHIKNQASKTSLQGIISALEGMKIRKDRRNILLKFNGKKNIFIGENDPVLNYKQAVYESEICKTKLVRFDGGHMTYIENKDVFLEKLMGFLT